MPDRLRYADLCDLADADLRQLVAQADTPQGQRLVCRTCGGQLRPTSGAFGWCGVCLREMAGTWQGASVAATPKRPDSVWIAAERVAVAPKAAPPEPEPPPQPEAPLTSDTASEVVQPQSQTLAAVGAYFGSVQWAWPGWMPKGHVSLLCGPQAVGKSFLAAHLLAVVTAGLPTWPDGAPYQDGPRNVLLVETESMRGAYAERLQTMGGDLSRVHLPSSDPTAIPQLPKDLPALTALAQSLRVGLVVVDSLSGGHSLDENGDAMRRVLQGLAAMAATLQVPVTCTHHLRKRSQLEPDRPTLDRVRGSSTISQFARSVIGLWRLDGAPDGPVRVESLKSSFCKPPEPFGFEITDDGLSFCEAPEETRDLTGQERAADFLLELLKDGPVAAAKLYEDGRLAGFQERMLRRAKDALRVATVNRSGKWYWSLPYERE